MPAYNVLLLSAALAGLIFSFAVYFLGKDALSKNTLALYNLAFSLWCFCQFMGEISFSAQRVLFWTRMNLLFATLIPFFFLCFVYAFLGIFFERKRRLFFFGILAFIFICLLPTPLFIEGLTSTSYFRYYPRGGIAYGLFAGAFLFQLFSGFFELFRALRSSSGARKNQISYIILASTLGFSGGILWFLPVFGVDIYPFGIFIMPLYLFAGTYAVIRHRLLDIKVVIGRWIVYTLMISVFTGVYIASTAVTLRFVQVSHGLISALPAILVLICFSLLFDPLRSRFQKMIDRLLFGPSYDYKSVLKQLSYSVSSCLTIEDLASLATGHLSEILGVKDTAFYIGDPRLCKYKLVKSTGLFMGLPGEYDMQNFPFKQKFSISVDEDFCEDSVFVPIVCGTSLKSFILLGKKHGRQMWNKQDLDLLETFSANACVALQNIFLSEKIMEDQFSLYRTEKISAIGMIAGEMAHEIKNPLTAMRGLMQVFTENISDDQFAKDFLNIMPRQIERINSVVNRLLRLEGSAGEVFAGERIIEEISIPELAGEILKLCAPQYESNSIRVIRDIEYPLKVKADREGLEQVFFNLILNAVQAMPEGGVLGIRTGKGQFEISDTGCGIKEEYLARVFDPFYTTKEGGAGLGLSVTKRILEDNGARIAVSSIPGKGSVFTVIFDDKDGSIGC
ncbi:MAG: ATP-binding protein [Candidatus Margulisiibacteriota bacterium]